MLRVRRIIDYFFVKNELAIYYFGKNQVTIYYFGKNESLTILFWQEWRRKLKRKDSISLRRALPCSTFLPSDKVGKIWDQQDHLFQTDETQTGMNELVLRKQSSVVLGLGGARFSLK